MPFIIKSVINGMVLDVKYEGKKSGTEVILWPYNGGKNQLWEYKNNMIYSKLSGLVLEMSAANFGGAVFTYTPHGGSHQKWYFDDDFTIRNGTGMVLNVEGNNFQQGTRIVGFQKQGGQNQKFRIEPFNNN
jgi:hypothetical protein